MSVDELPDFLTVDEAAGVLRIGRTSAYAYVRQWEGTGGTSGIPCVRIGRSLRVPKWAIERLLAGGTVAMLSHQEADDAA